MLADARKSSNSFLKRGLPDFLLMTFIQDVMSMCRGRVRRAADPTWSVP